MLNFIVTWLLTPRFGHRRTPAWLGIGASWLAAVVLGLGSAALAAVPGEDATRLAEARVEIEALKQDFESGRARIRCGIHKRLYTYVEQYGQDHLLEGGASDVSTEEPPLGGRDDDQLFGGVHVDELASVSPRQERSPRAVQPPEKTVGEVS